jgi:hypothetical protein
MALPGLLLIAACMAGGCASAPTESKSFEVVYRFENVRKQGSFDEWTSIASILNGHSGTPVKPEFGRSRRVGESELREVSATVAVERFGTLDDIQAELDALSSSPKESDGGWLGAIGLGDDSKPAGSAGIEFSLADARLRYASNFVTSTVSVLVSGYTAKGNVVRLYLRADEPPVAVNAGTSGQWTARVNVLPEAKSIYGSSQDPSGRTRPKYFRINTSTLRHENISQSEFDANAPVYTPPAPKHDKDAKDKNNAK